MHSCHHNIDALRSSLLSTLQTETSPFSICQQSFGSRQHLFAVLMSARMSQLPVQKTERMAYLSFRLGQPLAYWNIPGMSLMSRCCDVCCVGLIIKSQTGWVKAGRHNREALCFGSRVLNIAQKAPSQEPDWFVQTERIKMLNPRRSPAEPPLPPRRGRWEKSLVFRQVL